MVIFSESIQSVEINKKKDEAHNDFVLSFIWIFILTN